MNATSEACAEVREYMKAKHTPGPWRIHGKFIATDDATICQWASYVDEVDARLIAAAPDLLAAIYATRKLVTEAALTGFNCRDGDWAERLFANQAALSCAIAKAEGAQ